MLQALASPYYVEKYNFVMGASIGVANYPADGDSFETLFSAADTAMYQAKNIKNSFYIFSSELRDELMETTDIQQALPQALADGEFSLVYQPQVLDGQIPVGVEALIRWKNGDMGQVAPDRFIPVSEGNGMIIDIGHFVIDQASATSRKSIAITTARICICRLMFRFGNCRKTVYRAPVGEFVEV